MIPPNDCVHAKLILLQVPSLYLEVYDSKTLTEQYRICLEYIYPSSYIILDLTFLIVRQMLDLDI